MAVFRFNFVQIRTSLYEIAHPGASLQDGADHKKASGRRSSTSPAGRLGVLITNIMFALTIPAGGLKIKVTNVYVRANFTLI